MSRHPDPPLGSLISASRHRPHGHVRVLVVDDSSIVRRMLVGLLSGIAGIKVVGEAESASEGIRSAMTLRPNVVILDVQMPGGSGLDVLTHVKAKSPGVTVIMFSASRDQQVQERCRTMGADYCFVKPDEVPTLLSVLAQLAQRTGWDQAKGK